ncbi:MAG: hypothetical protein H6708_07195 [Kofleriaceae bacterium]|nr:hypothetical protein [Kofleriaceae bacterium]
MTFQDGTLAFATGWLDAAALAALIEGGAYRGATRVHLTRAPLGDDGVAYLARSGGFPAVTELALGGTGMTDAGAIAVARQAVGLDHLAVLDLGDVPAESDARGPRDPAGVSDRGVDELARSPRLPALRRIVRGHEHRMPCQGRDDTEIVAIRRADGRVVEAVIYHTIWP